MHVYQKSSVFPLAQLRDRITHINKLSMFRCMHLPYLNYMSDCMYHIQSPKTDFRLMLQSGHLYVKRFKLTLSDLLTSCISL